jgi:hypothetical protein
MTGMFQVVGDTGHVFPVVGCTGLFRERALTMTTGFMDTFMI